MSVADMEIKSWTEGDTEAAHFHAEHDEVIWVISGRLTVVTHVESSSGSLMEVKQQLYPSSRPILLKHWVAHSLAAATDSQTIHVRKVVSGVDALSYDDTHEFIPSEGESSDQD